MGKGHSECPLSTISFDLPPEFKLQISCNYEAKKNNARFVACLSFPIRALVIDRSPADATTASANKDALARDAGLEKINKPSTITSKTGYQYVLDTGKNIALNILTMLHEIEPGLVPENALAKPVCKIEPIFRNPLNLKCNS